MKSDYTLRFGVEKMVQKILVIFVFSFVFCAGLVFADDVCSCPGGLLGGRVRLVSDAGTEVNHGQAVNSGNGDYFVIWTNEGNSTLVRGALFGPFGGRKAPVITFESGSYGISGSFVGVAMGVSYNPVSRLFFVTWRTLVPSSNGNPSTIELRGQFVGADGKAAGPKVTISHLPTGYSGGEYQVAFAAQFYNPGRNEFLLAYTVLKYDFTQDKPIERILYLQRLDSQARPIGSRVAVNGHDTSVYDSQIRYAFQADRYIVGWTFSGNASFQIFSSDLKRIAGTKKLAAGTALDDLLNFRIAYSSAQQRFLAFWQIDDSRAKTLRTYERDVSASGIAISPVRELDFHVAVSEVKADPLTSGVVVLHEGTQNSIELTYLDETLSTAGTTPVNCGLGSYGRDVEMVYNQYQKQYFIVSISQDGVFGQRVSARPPRC